MKLVKECLFKKRYKNCSLLEFYKSPNLDFYNNELTEIPKEIGNLINLQRLHLYHNKLTEIPKEIGNLTNLQELDLSYNRFTEIPKELGKLTKLRYLNLNDNQIVEIPKQLGNLVNLRTLCFGNNKLVEIPNLINLSNLRELDMRYNYYIAKPEELLRKLTNLQKILLSDEELRDITIYNIK